MDTQAFSRSRALNNIPPSKLLTKLASVFKNCEDCSQKEINVANSLEVGLCKKCRLLTVSYQRFYEANIPVEYWDLKMEKDFHGYPGLLKKYNEYVSDFKTVSQNGTSLCLAGFHGLGKTMTLTCILKRASLKGYSCMYSTLSDIVSVLTLADAEDKFTARKELLMVDFLAIDEFDSRFIATENAADLFARTLESVFRTRSQNKLPTLMATNSPNVIETFSGSLKQSLSSLMRGYLEIYPVLGEDFRGKKKVE